jgi:hypothetical protein
MVAMALPVVNMGLVAGGAVFVLVRVRSGGRLPTLRSVYCSA